jgi:hypothetical protein
MQAQVVHHRRATLPWIPMLLAALIVFATVAGVQIALRGRGTSIPAVSTVDDSGGRSIGPHGAARIDSDTSKVWLDPTVAAREGRGFGVAYVDPAAEGAAAGPHPRTKFGGSVSDGTGRDPALRVTITRIEQAR